LSIGHPLSEKKDLCRTRIRIGLFFRLDIFAIDMIGTPTKDGNTISRIISFCQEISFCVFNQSVTNLFLRSLLAMLKAQRIVDAFSRNLSARSSTLAPVSKRFNIRSSLSARSLFLTS
jgi:hypothetical protein